MKKKQKHPITSFLQHKIKHYKTNLVHSLLVESFLTIPKAQQQQKMPWFGRSQCYKQTKQTKDTKQTNKG